MKPLLPILLFAVTSICRSDVLRVSELADAAGEGVERMVLKNEDREEVLFVKTEAVLGDSDVEEALPGPAFGGQISVKLNEGGGKKFKETTARMRHGRDRLAIIVDGRLISAPVVQETLGSSFVITFQGLELADLDDLARRLSGRPPRPAGEAPKPPSKIETVSFTEEEYQNKKAMREKMGIFHLDSVPTEEDLNKVLRKGMSRDEVLSLFGKPYMATDKRGDDDFFFIYQIAPEKRPDNPKREMLPDGFKADFADGKLSSWSLIESNASREEKVAGREEPTLKGILPDMDLSAGIPDLVAFVEGIVIPDPQQSVNKRDLQELISIAIMLSSTIKGVGEKDSLDANCDFMKTLSHNFEDVAALRKSANKGRVSVKKLNDTLSPYVFGEKELPEKTKPVEP